jgi:putative ABC transport system substrate-binding protein
MLLLGGVVTASRALRAQQKAMPLIGWLSTGSPGSAVEPFIAGFREGLAETSWVEGQNVGIEYRWAEGQYDRLPALAADLVSHKVDLIVTSGGTPPALAAKNATSTIPIVFSGVGDPVGFGLVANLARPGGNLTGFSSLTRELGPKRLEMLCELVPQATVIALLRNPDNAGNRGEDIMREAARAKGVQVEILQASTEAEIDAAFATIQQLHVGGLLVSADAFFASRRVQLVALAERNAVPAIYFNAIFASAGGLISYGTDNDAVFRQVGVYAGRILKDAKPADLPVQQPMTFKLAVNLKTAKALGITVPPSILARADEVIE